MIYEKFEQNNRFVCVLINSAFIPQIKVHRHITTVDGLVQGQISAIMQDIKGYIWFGTFNGVSRWDGKIFMSIQTHNGLPASQILDIEESNDSSIYIAAYGGGVLVYKNGNLDTINTKDGLLTDNITQIKSLKKDGIVFAGDDGNISKLKDGKLINWSKEIDFPKFDIFGIYESIDGRLYFATEKGLVVVDEKSLTVLTENDGLITDYLWSVNGDDNGNIYIGTNRGINKLKNGKISDLLFKGKPFRNAVFKIHLSKNGRVYYATNTGILVEKENKLEIMDESNGIVSKDNWSLLEGRNGLLYFGSNGKGISIYDPKEKIVNFNRNTGLKQEKVLSIQEGNQNQFYFGTRSGLTTFSNGKFKIYKSVEGERSNIIEVVHKNNAGQILLGTKNGLKIFKNGKISKFIQNKELHNNEIYSIAETKSGKLFVGTRFGVFSIKDNIVKKLEYFEDLGSIFIMSILATENDGVFFGSFDKGIFILKNNKFSQLTTQNRLSTNRINCLHQSQSDKILVGTQQGLNIIDKDSVVKIIDVTDGLTNNVIADINVDKTWKNISINL